MKNIPKKILFVLQIASIGADFPSRLKLFYETMRLELRFRGRSFSCALGARAGSAPFQFSGTLEELYTAHEIFFREEYRPVEPVTPPIVDLGGNTGLAAVWFSLAYPTFPLDVYEPDPRAFAILGRNIPQSARAYNEAVVGKEGPVAFHHSANLLSSSIYAIPQSREVTVNGITLDQVIDRAGGSVGVLKMDIEGAEFDAICASKRIKDVDFIVGETHPKKAGRDNRELSAFLNRTHRVTMEEHQGLFYAVRRTNIHHENAS